MDLSSIAYSLVLIFIRSYKWLELQVIRLFPGTARRIISERFEKIGVVHHLPGDKEWTKEDEERVRQQSDYKEIIHFKAHNNSFFVNFANLATLAHGEMYMEGHFDCAKSEEDFTQLIKRCMETNLYQEMYLNFWNRFLLHMEFYAFNLQTMSRAFEVGQKHYDLGNDLFESFLDPHMQYTCAYWAKADNLNDAQVHKMELIAKKLDLKPGMRVLDIGCGWGTLCRYLAKNYGVSCVGITVSEEGAQYARKKCTGLPVEIRVQDYRSLNEKFDRLVSIGMFEAVGHKNFRTYMKVAHRCLADDGVFLLHTIVSNHTNFPRNDPFSHKYIFPNGMIPYHTEMSEALDNLFVIEDLHNFGPDYAKTLNAWRDNFRTNWHQISHTYGERFYRMWMVYLSSGKAMFLSRKFQLWQLVLSKDGLKREYRAAR